MKKLFQTLLPGTGRGLKFRGLPPREHDTLMTEAGKLVGKDSSMIELKRKEWSLGVQKFIHSVTVEDGFKTSDDLRAEAVKWRRVTEQDLDSNFDEWFDAKDYAMMLDLFRQHHEISQDEVAAISGKVLEVSEV